MSEEHYKYHMKPLFRERMQSLLKDKADFQKFEDVVHKQPLNYIRCNTLKISPENLINKLSKKWKISQPFPSNKEIILIESPLAPGEIGNAPEHTEGEYYIQEVSSMMSALALAPKKDDVVIDLFASPGSKTTQIASYMNNYGTIIANELKPQRASVLVANLNRCGVSNALVTRDDAVNLCNKLSKAGYKFDKILLDAPCSGEGTLRSSPETFEMWNPKVIKKLSRQQKKFISTALKCLKKDGVLVYSTCTHAPEENEEIIDYALNNFPVEVKKINLPIKCRPGVSEWKNNSFNSQVSNTCRIYPQDNNSEGFFICKLFLKEEVK